MGIAIPVLRVPVLCHGLPVWVACYQYLVYEYRSQYRASIKCRVYACTVALQALPLCNGSGDAMPWNACAGHQRCTCIHPMSSSTYSHGCMQYCNTCACTQPSAVHGMYVPLSQGFGLGGYQPVTHGNTQGSVNQPSQSKKPSPGRQIVVFVHRLQICSIAAWCSSELN